MIVRIIASWRTSSASSTPQTSTSKGSWCFRGTWTLPLSEEGSRLMRIKVGIMGSADAARADELHEKAMALGQAVAARDLILLTGATTGSVYAAGKAAQTAGAWHIGISPAHNQQEHLDLYGLPTDACDAIIY